uniref:Uncharacterized protein n=1 Tax=Anguilla anguilla TaxID=7936 RepID=A0A0E9PY54_ANGAN
MSRFAKAVVNAQIKMTASYITFNLRSKFFF